MCVCVRACVCVCVQARELEGLRQQQTVKAAALELAAEEMATQQDGLSDLTQQCAATQVQLAGLREQVRNTLHSHSFCDQFSTRVCLAVCARLVFPPSGLLGGASLILNTC